jgi:uncharacterized protein (DUF1330 family)
MAVELCVLLWPQPGSEARLVAYEDQVLALLADHGARVRERVRTDQADGGPLEVHLLEFPSDQALEDYLTDDRRVALAHERDLAIARTQILRVSRD